ncbi:hypothetical protein SprV_0301323800 [Sparganum proliferum]
MRRPLPPRPPASSRAPGTCDSVLTIDSGRGACGSEPNLRWPISGWRLQRRRWSVDRHHALTLPVASWRKITESAQMSPEGINPFRSI